MPERDSITTAIAGRYGATTTGYRIMLNCTHDSEHLGMIEYLPALQRLQARDDAREENAP